MIARLVTFSIERRWLVLLFTAMAALAGVFALQRLPDRRGAGHHQQSGPGERAGAVPVARPDRTAGVLHHRDLARRHSGPGIHPLAQPQRLRADYRRVLGSHRHLFRAPAGGRAAAHGRRAVARRRHARDGADRHWARRHLHVDGRVPPARQDAPSKWRSRGCRATAAT